ncbi:MAG: IS701 family transposase [Ktedonobacteraceae bacterium]
MTIKELEAWREEFEQFHARFADLFERSESREQAKKYLRGLLAQADRKNSWQVAEVVGDRVPDRMQRLLYRVPWDVEAARDRLQAFVIENFADEEGIGVVDETSFVKKGTHSVGVARQYLGAAGKLENGQVATVLSYAAKGAHVFLDRELYLPEEWVWDKQRCTEARVPEGVRFTTKPQQAIAMLLHAWEQGVPMRWVTGDEVYGDAPRLRETIQANGRFYVLAVSANTRVWTQRPEVQEPQEQTGGRPRHARRLAPGAPSARMVSEVVASWPSHAWKRLAVVEGEKGPIEYYWARAQVVESRDQLPGPDIWLLARRSLSDPKQIAYYLAYAPAKSSLATLVSVASQRYTVEQCIEEAKGETGLDEYEVRFWHSWYRHITLSMMAHAWLASIRKQEQGKKSSGTDELAGVTVPEVRRLLAIALPLPVRSPELRLAWSIFRRRKRFWARRSHYQRRALRRHSRPRSCAPL